MDANTAVVRSLSMAEACRARIKRAAMPEFASIAEVPVPGQRYSNQALENDYQFKHPILSNLHPGLWGGTALGAVALKKYLGGSFMGGTVGGAAGMGLEGLHRLKFMLDAKHKLEHGESPLDERYRL